MTQTQPNTKLKKKWRERVTYRIRMFVKSAVIYFKGNPYWYLLQAGTCELSEWHPPLEKHNQEIMTYYKRGHVSCPSDTRPSHIRRRVGLLGGRWSEVIDSEVIDSDSVLWTGDMRINARPFILWIPSPMDRNCSDFIGECWCCLLSFVNWHTMDPSNNEKWEQANFV